MISYPAMLRAWLIWSLLITSLRRACWTTSTRDFQRKSFTYVNKIKSRKLKGKIKEAIYWWFVLDLYGLYFNCRYAYFSFWNPQYIIIFILVNPYREIDIYNPDIAHLYATAPDKTVLPPHVFAGIYLFLKYIIFNWNVLN